MRFLVPEGGTKDVVGYVTASDAETLTVLDRRGQEHVVVQDAIVAGHQVPVSRGRDPLRMETELLDGMAARAGLDGRRFVIRLYDLLEGRPPMASVHPPEIGLIDGEWVTTAASQPLDEVGWWAARTGVRSMQVRTADPDEIARLLALGFSELA